jgi:hypothetical protein
LVRRKAPEVIDEPSALGGDADVAAATFATTYWSPLLIAQVDPRRS